MTNQGLIGKLFPGFLPMMTMHAEQAGASRAERLWQGRFLSSNASIDGRMVDFGSFRQVPNWRRLSGQPKEVFGAEVEQLKAAANSVSFYLYRNYGGESSRQILDSVYKAISDSNISAFQRQCDFGFGVVNLEKPQSISELRDAITNFYGVQQLNNGAADGPESTVTPWLLDLRTTPEAAAKEMTNLELSAGSYVLALLAEQDRGNRNSIFSQRALRG